MKFIFNFFVGPIVAAWLVSIGLRQRMRAIWPAVGLALIALSSAVFTLYVDFATPQNPHGGVIGVSLVPFLFGHPTFDLSSFPMTVFRAVVTLAVGTSVYLVLRAHIMSNRSRDAQR